MKLEEAIARLTTDITKPLACGDICVVSISDVEIVLDELENKENKIHKCLETINQLKAGEYTKGSKHYYSSLCCNARLDIIKDLLEDNK